MKMPRALYELIQQFMLLPGVGPKTAERFALSVVKKPPHVVSAFANAILRAQEALTLCPQCFDITEHSPTKRCPICANSERSQQTICVVADSADIIALEKPGTYTGVYHVLGGLIHPLRGMTPKHLRVAELERRIKQHAVQEIILALNLDADGETTMMYLAQCLKPHNVRVTRLARGLPTGSNVEYADERTIASALADRKVMT